MRKIRKTCAPNCSIIRAPSQIAAALKALSGQSRMVIGRLFRFGELPVQEWRFHIGDVQGGQSPAFDDSSWQQKAEIPVQTTDMVWLREKIVIPAGQRL